MKKIHLEDTDDQHLLALIYSMAQELVRRSGGKLTITDIAQDLLYIDNMKDNKEN